MTVKVTFNWKGVVKPFEMLEIVSVLYLGK